MDGLPKPGDPFWAFCGFVNGTDFRTTYFMDQSTLTLTPCAEFALISAQSIPLFFFSVLNLSLVSGSFPRYTLPSISRIISLRIIICFFTIIALLSSLAIANFFVFPLKSVLQIEYGLLVVVWSAFALLWIMSLSYKSWTRSRGLSVSAFFASKVFYLILINRILLYGVSDPRAYSIIAIATIQTAGSIMNIVEWRIHKQFHTNSHHRLDNEGVSLCSKSDEGAGFFSRIFFCWTNQLIKKGGKRQLNQLEDVFELPPSLQVDRIEQEMVEYSPTFFSDGLPYSIQKSLLHTFGLAFFSLAILRLASDAFTFAGPVVLHLLIDELEKPKPTTECYIYAGLMVVSAFLAAIFSTNFNYYVQKVGLRVRAALVTSIYEKLMRVPLGEMSGFSSGKILNFISTDVDRIVNFCNSFHAFWSLPVQLCLALYLLYREVGPAFLSGVVAAIVLIPINKVITNNIGKMSEKLMFHKDQRMKMVTEMVQGIRTVKMSSWEKYFEERIAAIRQKELYYLKVRKYLDAVCVYLWASAPLIIVVSILTTYTLVFHERLTAAKVFTSLALVNILIMPLNAFPWVLNGLVEALVSVKRLEWFFALNNLDVFELYRASRNENRVLSVSKGNFFWKNGSSVGGVEMECNKGTIVGINGEVGAGKSTLLHGLLGETKYLTEGIEIQHECISSGIGYIGQDRWLSRGSIRDNILSGKPFDEKRYEEILKKTCLSRDINLMPGGDQYEISENGSTLSGGQRTRVALARVLYQDNSLMLLDEPLASLDSSVAEAIWTQAIEPLRAQGKVVIIATHDSRFLPRMDTVLQLNRQGHVIKTGTPQEVLGTKEVTIAAAESHEEEEEAPVERITSQDEEKQVGAVKVNVYGAYVQATGYCLFGFILASLFAMQFSKNAADWWLSRWTENQNFENSTDSGNSSEGVMNSLQSLMWAPRNVEYLSDSEYDRSIYFLTIYGSIAAANTIFTLVRAFLFAYGGVVAAKKMHADLLKKLLSTSVTWWDRTPAGRIINRLCADIYTIDDNLPFQLNIFLASLFNLVGALVISVMGLPLIIPMIIILFIIYYFIQKYYRLTTVELKRLSSLSLSPFYSHLADTVNGLVTIRAQRFTERFRDELRLLLSNNLRTQFSSLAASQWLSVRLSLIAVAVVAAISVSAILQHGFLGVDSGLVGLAITYALSMTSLLSGLLGSFIETEKEMVSVERIDEYLENIEDERDVGKIKMPSDINGRIDFAAVSLRYSRDLPLAIENVSFRVEAGQRVAVVGRTGSGKSSLFQALLRICPLESGRISIDGIDISSLPLHECRKIFGVIPQHPFIFSGTLYDNLVLNSPRVDRNNVATIVRVSNLESLLTRIGGLDGILEEGGKNLSYGEKQVISICRVMLSKPRIVLVDEATSNLDPKAHDRMTKLLSVHLPLATVISIIHVQTNIKEYDLVLKMEKGQLIPPEVPSEF